MLTRPRARDAWRGSLERARSLRAALALDLGVAPPPPYAIAAEGAIVVDVDGHEAIDLHGDYSALVHGNAYAPVLAAARAALEAGSAFGLPTAAEVDLAECLAARIGWAERWRFTGSGSEAVMAAVRAARAASGREKVVRFADCYHGGWDALAKPGARGVPEGVRREVLTLPLGDASALMRALDEHDGQVACVLLDPMPNRAGLRPVEPSFAQLVREQTRARGVALIVDEVITFRMAPGGMQAAVWDRGRHRHARQADRRRPARGCARRPPRVDGRIRPEPARRRGFGWHVRCQSGLDAGRPGGFAGPRRVRDRADRRARRAFARRPGRAWAMR